MANPEARLATILRRGREIEVGEARQGGRSDDTPSTGNRHATFANVLAAAEEAGDKLRPKDLLRLFSLMSLGTIAFVLSTVLAAGALGYSVRGWFMEPVRAQTIIADKVGWGSLQGPEAAESFVNGGEARRLSGTWSADWWMDLPDGSEEPYSYLDKDGNKVSYPTEEIFMQGVNAIVSCKVAYSSGENIWYWYEGRLSAGGHVTLLYWVERGDGREKLVGVVFLRFVEGLLGNHPSTLSGRWIGFVRDGKMVEGRTLWTKRG